MNFKSAAQGKYELTHISRLSGRVVVTSGSLRGSRNVVDIGIITDEVSVRLGSNREVGHDLGVILELQYESVG